MLTMFAIPKAFKGQFDAIQTNAIRSWTLLKPRPEIILLGDDEGTAEICERYGLRHEPSVGRNEYGTPLVNEIFEKAQALAGNDLMCYVNADIILMSDFMEAVTRATGLMGDKEFLAIGRKINVPLDHLLDFEQDDWESRLRDLVAAEGSYVTPDSDFFVFRRGLYRDIPPFAIGRCFWTQWLVYNARQQRVPVIDATRVVTSVEPRHDYSHAVSTGGATRLSGAEYESNRRAFKGCKYFTTADATHVMTVDGLRDRPLLNLLLSPMIRFEYFVYFLLKGTLYPYSLPLIVALRWARSSLQKVVRPFRYLQKVAP